MHKIFTQYHQSNKQINFAAARNLRDFKQVFRWNSQYAALKRAK